MNKKVLVGLIIAVIFVTSIYGLLFVRPIFPGKYVEILYPRSGADVPSEFSVVGVGTSWSYGIQIERILAASIVRTTLSGSSATLTVDGEPYTSTSGGNHHVFFLRLPEGPHTIRLLTLFGEDEIIVQVKNDVPLRFEAIPDERRYIEAVDRLKAALSEYRGSLSSPIGTDIQNDYCRISLTETGAFLLFGASINRRITAYGVRYVEFGDRPVTADDIAGAPVLFSWDENTWENLVKISAADSCGDRLLFCFIDTDSLQLFYIHPDGSVVMNSYPLSAVSPDFAGAIADAPYIEMLTNCKKDYAIFRIYASSGFFRFALQDGLLFPVREDYGATEALFLENGDMIKGGAPYPAYESFESLFADREEWTDVYVPLPGTGPAYSFTGGTVRAGTSGFSPLYPRLNVHPLVPGAEYEAEPAYRNVGGSVFFPQGMVECTIGDTRGYFRVTPSKRQ